MPDHVNEQVLPHGCVCGRRFAKRAGLLIHQRTCPVEHERSEDFIAEVSGTMSRADYNSKWRERWTAAKSPIRGGEATS